MRDLALRATRAALEVRRQFRRPLGCALCPYDLATEMSIELRFVAVPSLEGMYIGSEAPLILINSLRPAGRRAQTCGHELGHHIFGHGDRIDELRGSAQNRGFDPDEYLAHRFAMALLMPKLAVERAFAQRGWSARTPTGAQVYVISTYFGVGYTTLISYMERTLRVLPSCDAAVLSALKPKDLRAEIWPAGETTNLIVADAAWDGRPIDLEVGDVLALPSGAVIEGDVVVPERTHPRLILRAVARGSSSVSLPRSSWSCSIRVAPRQYQGLAKYRYLEDPDADE